MRRVACIALAGAALGAPAAAEAHTLTMPRALAKAGEYASKLAAQTDPALNRGSAVTGCRRVNPHIVDCAFYTLTDSDPPINKAYRCDDAVRVFYSTNRGYYIYTRPLGTPTCYPVSG